MRAKITEIIRAISLPFSDKKKNETTRRFKKTKNRRLDALLGENVDRNVDPPSPISIQTKNKPPIVKPNEQKSITRPRKRYRACIYIYIRTMSIVRYSFEKTGPLSPSSSPSPSPYRSLEYCDF